MVDGDAGGGVGVECAFLKRNLLFTRALQMSTVRSRCVPGRYK